MSLTGCAGASWLPTADPAAQYAEKPQDCVAPAAASELAKVRQRACQMHVAYAEAMGTAQSLSDKINLGLLGLGAATAGLAMTGTTGAPLIALALAGATGFTANELFVPRRAHREIFAVGAEASYCVRGLADDYLRAAGKIPGLRQAITNLQTARDGLEQETKKLDALLKSATANEQTSDYWKAAKELVDSVGPVVTSADTLMAAAQAQIAGIEVTAPEELNRALTAVRVAIKKAALASSADTATVQNAVRSFQASVPAAYAGLLGTNLVKTKEKGDKGEAEKKDNAKRLAAQDPRRQRSALSLLTTSEPAITQQMGVVRARVDATAAARTALKAASDSAAVADAATRLQECVTKAQSAPQQLQVHVSPASVSAKQDETVHVAILDGNGPYTAGLINTDPTKTDIKLPPGPIAPDPNSKVADLPITVGKEVTPGSYAILVTDAGGGKLQTSTQILLTVTAAEAKDAKNADARLRTRGETERVVQAGETLSLTLLPDQAPYFIDGLEGPGGVDPTFRVGPQPPRDFDTSTVTFTVPRSAPPGRYTLRYSDGTGRQQELHFTVTAPPSPARLSAPAPEAVGASEDVRVAQVLLGRQGFEAGPADGRLGTRTVAGLKKLQEVKRLEPPDGTLNAATRKALGMPERPLTPVDVERAQAALRQRGDYDGPIDGVVGARTEAALKKFQRARGLPETGVLDGATWSALATEAPPTPLPKPGTR